MPKRTSLIAIAAGLAGLAGCTAMDATDTRVQSATTLYQGSYGTGLVTARPGQQVSVVLGYLPPDPTQPPDPQQPPDPGVGVRARLVDRDGATLVDVPATLGPGRITRATYIVPVGGPAMVVYGAATVQPPDPGLDATQPPDPQKLQLTVEIADLTVDAQGRVRAQTQLVLPGTLVGFNPQPEPPATLDVMFGRALGGPDPGTLELHLVYQPPDPAAPAADTRLVIRSPTGALLADSGLDRLVAGDTVSLRATLPRGTGPVFALWGIADGVDLASLLPSLEIGTARVTRTVVPPASLAGFNPQPEPPAE